MSFVVTSFLLGTSLRARTHYCGTPHWQHQSKASSFPRFGCRIIYLFFNYCRSHVLLLVQTFSILSELHGDKFPSLGFDCFNQLYGLLIFSSSKNSVWVKVLLNPCSSEENNGNNYRKQKNTGVGKFIVPMWQLALSWLRWRGGSSLALVLLVPNELWLVGFAAVSNPVPKCFCWAVK